MSQHAVSLVRPRRFWSLKLSSEGPRTHTNNIQLLYLVSQHNKFNLIRIDSGQLFYQDLYIWIPSPPALSPNHLLLPFQYNILIVHFPHHICFLCLSISKHTTITTQFPVHHRLISYYSWLPISNFISLMILSLKYHPTSRFIDDNMMLDSNSNFAVFGDFPPHQYSFPKQNNSRRFFAPRLQLKLVRRVFVL